MIAQDLIDRALEICGVLTIGETPNALERTDAFTRLNTMIGNWSADGLMLPGLTNVAITTDGNTESWTIGLTGTTVLAPKPIAVKHAVCTSAQIAKDVEIVTPDRYVRESHNKSLKSRWARFGTYDPGPFKASGTLSFWPIIQAGSALDVHYYMALQQYAAIDQDVLLPDPYTQALMYGLAVLSAPLFGVKLAQTVIDEANNSKAAIRGLNEALLGWPTGIQPESKQ